MNRLLLLVIAFALALPGSVFAAIVYSGSQNVTLQLQGGDAPPLEREVISIAGSMASWDDFRVDLWYNNGMMMGAMDMMGMSHLAIYAPMYMGPLGMAMGAIVGLGDFVSNLAPGAVIGPDSPMVDWGYLYGSGEFGEEGGYIGLMTALGQHGWLHVSGQSGMGTNIHSVMFDGWAYESQPGTPIGAGEIPAPGAFVLGCLGIGLATWFRRRRAF